MINFNKFSKQRGFSATAMMVMLAIGAIAMIGVSRETIIKAAQVKGESYGNTLLKINNAVGLYQIQNAATLILAPTTEVSIAQLNSFLGANFSDSSPLGGVSIRISSEPSGCVAPNCSLTSQVVFKLPVLNSETGNVDARVLEAAMGKLSGDAGYSDASTPGTIRGANWDRPNPFNVPGTLMAINGYGSSVFAQFVDRAGKQGMLADFEMGGNSIKDAKNITAKHLALPMGTSLALGVNSIYSDELNTAIRQQGGIYIQRNDGSSGDINQVNNINAGGTASSRSVVTNDLSSSTAYAAQEVRTGGWFKTDGDAGWYSNKWGGGMYMSDGTWLRTVNDKGVYTGGQVQAGTLQSNGSLTVAGMATVGSQTVAGAQVIGGNQTVYGNTAVTQALTPGQIAVSGAGCAGNQGAIARDANNNLYVCN
ncbi:hypothetical protein JAB4_059270 (plasmid) [Janthinobacterium sp. HH102]|uniref:shufflon system plasmid conjugative transfer pilus tip adhesin PilV n=1 Tax=Janthinobacterium sp. HH102 TaxID=1537274 RepID=UPI000893802C|nr:shufflon system plasmid conjugative transfer pilus tip adhesin PilV [Janthinobacterium sp. HH102]QOU76427.1 hypothetical protein JAB4_059270 [Janthinobacterium sp. HH102]